MAQFRKLPLFLALLLTTLFYTPLMTQAQSASQANSSAPLVNQSLDAFLNPDGTLNLDKSTAGNLDVTGWRMVTDGSAPRFIPTTSSLEQSSPFARAITALPGDENWANLFTPPGTNSNVRTAVLDGSGNLYIGGNFTTIGTLVVNRVAKWDGTTWSALGTGFPSNSPATTNVNALMWVGSTLYAGGNFSVATGGPADRIAQWNGSTWTALGSGTSGAVNALATDGTSLYVGGLFTTAGGITVNNIAKWNGSWSAMNGGTGGQVNVLAYSASSPGSLYVGGSFTSIPNIPTAGAVNRVARVNTTTLVWARLGLSVANNGTTGTVSAITVNAGNVYVGGSFTQVNAGTVGAAGNVPANRVALFNGVSWSALASGFSSGQVNALTLDGSGNVYAGGSFTLSGATTVNRVAFWNGSTWSALNTGIIGSGSDAVFALAFSAPSTLYVGGAFTVADTVGASNIARWNGTTWTSLMSGQGVGAASAASQINALVTSGTNVYAGGTFLAAGNVPANRIAMWNGTSWQALGTGMNNQVNALAVGPGGVLYVGGNFTTAGGMPANAIAMWNGSTWSPLGTGITGSVLGLFVDSSGNVYASGSFTAAGGSPASGIAKWDGVTWSNLNGGVTGGLPAAIGYAVTADASNNIYVAGSFTTAGGVPANNIAKWDGSSWSALGAGTGGIVRTLAFDGSTLYVGGGFNTVSAPSITVNHVAKWDGTNWSSLGTGTDGSFVYAIVTDNVGNVYVAGDFANAGGGAAENGLAYWDGATWQALGTGLSSLTTLATNALALDKGGYLYAGGVFDAAGGKTSFSFARWTVLVEKCAVTTGNNVFYTSTMPLTINIATLGDLDCIQVQRYDKTHPSAITGLQTGYYWHIDGTNSGGTAATGYNVALTLPTVPPATANDQVCRYTGAGWDCGASSFAGNTVTRTGVTAFSDWAVGPNTPVTLSSVNLTSSLNEGGTATLTGNINGPELSDTFVLTVNWGDGTPVQTFNYAAGTTSFNETHVYPDDNPTATPSDINSVSLSLSDGFSTSSAVTSITVNNVLPTLAAVSATAVAENGTTTLSGNIVDPGTQDTFSLVVDWGDGNTDTYALTAGTTALNQSHQYLDDNPTATPSDNYAIALTITDDDTGSNTGGTTVTVNNVAPTLAALNATAVNENGTTTLSGNIVDPGTLDTFTLVVDWGDGTAPQTFNYPAGTPNFSQTHQYLDDNPTGTPSDNYSIALTITDDDTGSSTTSTTVTVNNVAPSLAGLNATAVNENGFTTLTGNINDPGTQDSFSLVVDWGDGTAPQTFNYGAGTANFSQTHQYLDDNPTGTPSDNVTIALTISDDDTGSSSTTTAVTVNNVPPTLSGVSATANVSEGGTATLTGNISDTGTQDSFSLIVDWGDGTVPQTFTYPAGTPNFSQTHIYADDNPTGTPSDITTINLTLTDDDTGSDTGSTTLTVSNIAPTLSAVSATAVNENGTTTLTGSISDPSPLDSFSLVINWGDGTAPQTVALAAGSTNFSQTHTYLDDNPTGTPSDNVTIALTLTDDDTGSDTDSTNITVSNVAPAFNNVVATPLINENNTITVTGNIVDPGTLDTFTLFVDWQDDSTNNYSYGAGSTNFLVTHTYLDDGFVPVANFTLDLTLTDDDTGSSSTTTTVSVNNVAPDLTNVATTAVNENGTTTLSGNIVEVSPLDTFTLTVNWGDGSSNVYTYPAGSTTFAQTHQYLDDNPSSTPSDNIPLTLTLADDNGGVDVVNTSVTVNNVAPTITGFSATSATNENGVINLSGTFTDPGSQDSFALSVDWGDGTTDTLTYTVGATSFAATHQYLDDNPTGTPSDTAVIAFTLSDDDTGSDSQTTSVTINNVDPVVEAGPNQVAVTGFPVAFGAVLTDVGTLDTHTILWDFGDGATAVNTLTPNHTYAATGVYTVSLTVTDDDTGSASDSLRVTVRPSAIFLPFVANHKVVAPDLIVEAIVVSSTDVQITLTNQGTAAVQTAFWVDLYINPNPAPTAVNQTWDQLATEGLVWGITDPSALVPGGSLTINLSHASYRPDLSNFNGTFSSGMVVYVQVDSAHTQTVYGNVDETHELLGQPYNNISQTTVTALHPSTTAPTSANKPSQWHPLPPRQ